MLDTVQDYINIARSILQDEVVPYRYADSKYITALNASMLEARKLRPDMFLKAKIIPSYSSLSSLVSFEPQYRMAVVYYICGHVQLIDDEAMQDSRAAVFLNKFTSQLVTLAA